MSDQKEVMTPRKFAALMRELAEDAEGDAEDPHYQADELMCEILEGLGYHVGVRVFRDMKRWYA